MSDTKIQIKNSMNRSVIHHLERLYKKEKAIRNELRFVKKWKREGQIYVSFGTLKNYDINWAIKILKGDLIANQSMIKQVRSELVIC